MAKLVAGKLKGVDTADIELADLQGIAKAACSGGSTIDPADVEAVNDELEIRDLVARNAEKDAAYAAKQEQDKVDAAQAKADAKQDKADAKADAKDKKDK